MKLGLGKGIAVQGIEILLEGEAYSGVRITRLKKSNQTVSVDLRSNSLLAYVSQLSNIDSQVPACVIVTGAKVILMRIPISEKPEAAALLNSILPGAKEQELYVQWLSIGNSEALVGITRREPVDNLLAEFKQKGVKVVGCFLDILALSSISGIIEGSEHYLEIPVSGKCAVIKDRKLIDIKEGEASGSQFIEVGDDKIEAESLLSYAAAMSYFIPNQQIKDNISEIRASAQEYKEEGKFKFSLAAYVFSLFALLLINYFVFNHYYSKKSELEGIETSNSSALSQVDTLRKQLAEKRSLMEKTGLSRGSMLSYYADRIAASMPGGIRLAGMRIFPKKKQVGSESRVEFTGNTIQIAGIAGNSAEVNTWVAGLSKLDFSGNVSLKNFSQEGSGQSGEFELEMTLK